MIKTLSSSAGGTSLIAGQGTKILHAAGCGQKSLKKKKKEPECLPWEELWLLRCQLGLNFDTATLGSVPLGKLLNIPEHQFSLQ